MFEQVAQKTWKLTSDSPDLVPELVEEVARKGGSFLIFRNEYISVTRAMENKALYEKYLKIAMHNLSEHEVATPGDKFVYAWRIQDALSSSGFAFNSYCYELNAGIPNRVRVEFPEELSAFHEFREHFDKHLTRSHSYYPSSESEVS